MEQDLRITSTSSDVQPFLKIDRGLAETIDSSLIRTSIKTQVSETINQTINQVDPQVIDLTTFEALKSTIRGDAAAFLVQVIDCYCEEATKLLQLTHTALAQNDVKTLRRVFHTLKSGSATVGAISLRDLVTQLEELTITGMLEDVAAQLPHLEFEYKKVQVILQIERQKYQ